MSKKILIVVIMLLIFTTGGAYYYFVMNSNNITSAESIIDNKKSTYKEIAKIALKNSDKNLNAEEKYALQFDVVYQAIFEREAENLFTEINISKEETDEYISNTANKHIVKVYNLEASNGNWDYMTYSTDHDLKDYKIGDTLLNCKILNIREPSAEEVKSAAIKELKSKQLVEKINNKVEEIIN